MSSPLLSQLTENLERVRTRMQAACHRANRSVGDVTLIAVTKYAEMDWVRGLIELGVNELGESRPQQLVARAGQLPADLQWNMIGHLQRNKVEIVLPVATRIHSVDSVRLLDAIQSAARKQEIRPQILLEVNVSGEGSKDGFAVTDLIAAWPSIIAMDAVAIQGLMTMAPLSEDVQQARPVFRALRELRDRLRDNSGGRLALPELSMGMSGDFEIGIEEGATFIRVGSSLFESLPAPVK